MENMLTCIIPFYNEGENLFGVVTSVIKVKYINQIICVDDGSGDRTYKKLLAKFPDVVLIRLDENKG